jgi:hypothetical protein
VNARHPILVTTRVMPDVARLRTEEMYGAIREAVARATKWLYHDDEPFRIVHASVQGNHLHLLVEAASNAALTRGMKGNWRKHGEARAGDRSDPYSSAFALPDWSPSQTIVLRDVPMFLPVALPRTWLLAEGWRRAGSISPWTKPGAA